MFNVVHIWCPFCISCFYTQLVIYVTLCFALFMLVFFVLSVVLILCFFDDRASCNCAAVSCRFVKESTCTCCDKWIRTGSLVNVTDLLGYFQSATLRYLYVGGKLL